MQERDHYERLLCVSILVQFTHQRLRGDHGELVEREGTRRSLVQSAREPVGANDVREDAVTILYPMVEFAALNVVQHELVVDLDEIVNFGVRRPVQIDGLLAGARVSIPADWREPERQDLVDNFPLFLRDGLVLILEGERSACLMRVPLCLNGRQSVEVFVFRDVIHRRLALFHPLRRSSASERGRGLWRPLHGVEARSSYGSVQRFPVVDRSLRIKLHRQLRVQGLRLLDEGPRFSAGREGALGRVALAKSTRRILASRLPAL